MNKKDEEQLKLEISHIFESGVNEIRIQNMVKDFISKRFVYRDEYANVQRELVDWCYNNVSPHTENELHIILNKIK
jgi:hypothetical protein